MFTPNKVGRRPTFSPQQRQLADRPGHRLRLAHEEDQIGGQWRSDG